MHAILHFKITNQLFLVWYKDFKSKDLNSHWYISFLNITAYNAVWLAKWNQKLKIEWKIVCSKFIAQNEK